MATEKERKNILVRDSYECRENQTHYSNFGINQNHYGKEGEDDLISLPEDLLPDDYLQKCLNHARDDAEESRIKHEFETRKVGTILKRRSMANNTMLQTVKEGSKFDGDDVEIVEAIEWSRRVCQRAEDKGYFVYAFKASVDENGVLKQGEAINKIDGGSHAIFIGVPEWSAKFDRWVVRKLKKEEIGIIGEKPKLGQLIQVSWESLGCTHTETHSLLFEAVETHTLKCYFPKDRQQCFNIDYTGIPRKHNDKFVQLSAILSVKVLVPIGRDGVCYTERGLNLTGRFPITGLPNQEGNVLPLKNDLERKWRKEQKAKAAASIKNWLNKPKSNEDDDNMQDSVLRATSTKSAVDSSDSEATSQESNLRVILTQSSQSETQSSDSETQSSDSETQSGKDSETHSGKDSEPPQLNTSAFDDSEEDDDDDDDDDDCEEKQEQAAKIDMILMYNEEHGRDVVEKYGALLVLKDRIKNDPYYDEDTLQLWFNSIVGHRNNRDYRELTEDELHALHTINVFPNDEQYLKLMADAYNMWMREIQAKSANKRQNESNSNGTARRVRKMIPLETDSDDSDSESDD